ncbi:WxL domain-containing protein [Enterococcus faecalis]|uniref:WxL domain-containing protein n=1 Tax=Enterococcus faecalis TaxID=1351 RepID=UPI00192676F9|nr:WxL domain-containing protein [Enterococcus faecalis]UKV05424.1 WxL domain-containing protein [Enterococcus faecalis]
MKQTKWQRLATIGLCSSLVINAFSGVTAVAETITIESSPTVASSAKEATSASSATPASTESSQETTETSREEVTQETEKPEVVEKISDDKEKTVISDYLNKGAKTIPEINKISPKATYNFPKVNYQFGFVDEAGNLMNPAPFSILFDYARGDRTTVPVKWTVISANEKATDSADNLKNMVVPAVSLAQPAGGAIYSVPSNFRLTIPKYYSSISIYNSDGKINPKYPVPIVKQYDSGVINNWIDEFHALNLTKDEAGYYKMYDTSVDGHGYPLLMQRYVTPPGKISHNVYTYFSGPVYYHLINRKVTENFVDDNGTKITPPTGFTQGKQTVIDSDPYTFKQSGTLPETYKASNGKTYKFKGWYKGKTKPNTLTATKAPSYAVTYDDNDDLNVVYEEIEAFDFPALTYQFGFVGEDGKLANPADINITYDYKTSAYRGTGGGADDTVSFGTIATNQSATTVGNLKNVTMPATSIARPTETGYNGDAYANFSIKLPRYYQSLNLYDKTGKINPSYPLPAYTRKYSVRYDDQILPEASVIAFLRLTQKPDQSYAPYESYSVVDPSVKYPEFLQRVIYSTDMVSGYANYTTFSSPVYYHLTNRKVTENFVDANGTKITPPTGFTQGNQIPMTSNTFKYTAAKALPATYTAGGKTYTFQGWYKGKTKPNTLTTSTTPTYNTTFDGNDDMTAMYKEEVPKASVALTRTTAETVTSGGNVTWRATITNTSQAPLTTATIKKSTAWTTGLAAPTAMIVTPAGGTAKTVPVTATTWTNGVSLGTDIPAGKSATVQFTTKATGTAGQVLRAGITTSGNYSGVSTSATVRVKDNDQAIVTPTAEGFISVPTFNFGQVGVAGSTQQHSLKKAADYYGNGTRNPYLRIKKTQPNWSLTAQLSQPKSATDSLPTATRLLLGAAPVSSFSNYNQPTELKNAVGTTSAISLNANNTATRIIANQQFTGSNIYQLDFTFNNVKLEVPANQGVKGQQYQAAITWNLVTGP